MVLSIIKDTFILENVHERILHLYTKWVNKELSEDETGELSQLLERKDVEEILSPSMYKIWSKKDLSEASVGLSEEQVDKLMSRLPKEEEITVIPRVHRVHFLKTAWFRYAAAMIIALGIGTYLWNIQQKEKPEITETKPAPVKNDIMPGSNRAMLTLSNGQQVELNNAASETIKDGTVLIENNDGQLIYKKGDRVAMNTMTTPKGGQYQLTLADGTIVWLNAASSITYPTAFTSGTREVTITGEAYFEVKKNPAKPFVVKTPKENIMVLGTGFNVNAYAEELAMKTSLVEGSIKVGNLVLQPGQAYINGKVVQTNLEQDIAWKNGVFNFHQLPLKEAMKQLSRWYEVDVEFRGDVSDIRLGGEIGMQLSLLQVLKGLEDADIRFDLAAKKLTVIRK